MECVSISFKEGSLMSRVYNQFCIKCGEDTPHEDLDKKMSCIVCYETMPTPTDPYLYDDEGEALDMLDQEEDIDSLDEIRDKEYSDWDNGYNYDDWN